MERAKSSMERAKSVVATADAKSFRNIFSKRRNQYALGLFLLLVSRVAYMHYERHKLWNKILSTYDTDTKDNRLNSADVVNFLKDSGVNVTQGQLKSWLGRIDDEKDGFDEEELMRIIDFFDNMDSWRSSKKVGRDISSTQLSHLSAVYDFAFLVIFGMGLVYFLLNSEAMDKRVAANSFVSAVRVANMKRKWMTKEQEIESYSNEKSLLQAKIDEMEAMTTKSAASMEEAANMRMELAEVSSKQEAAEAELVRIRENAQKHMTEAHMSTTKLRAMQTMLRGVDAVGSASPFQGAAKGDYQAQGARMGFAKRRCNTKDLGSKAATGLLMQTFLFGYPTDNDFVFYEVDKTRDLLGEGADCAYKCRDIATKEELCVKIYDIAKHSQKQQIMNDLRTKQAISEHPHIVRYHAVVETQEQIFVLMELLPGVDLFGHIVNKGGLSESSAAKIFYQLCDALQFCHDNGIVHGDVKPENAMIICPESESPTCKLIDFGFACFPDAGGNLGRCVMDKYAAPEAFEGKPSSKEVDSFRLGCSLYVMVMATYPFQSEGAESVPARKAGKVVPYPKWKTLSAEVQDLIVTLCRDRLPIKEAQSHAWVKKHVGKVDIAGEVA